MSIFSAVNFNDYEIESCNDCIFYIKLTYMFTSHLETIVIGTLNVYIICTCVCVKDMMIEAKLEYVLLYWVV